MAYCWKRDAAAGTVCRPAVVRQTTVEGAACARLANTHSPRDNRSYRAALARRNRPRNPANDGFRRAGTRPIRAGRI